MKFKLSLVASFTALFAFSQAHADMNAYQKAAFAEARKHKQAEYMLGSEGQPPPETMPRTMPPAAQQAQPAPPIRNTSTMASRMMPAPAARPVQPAPPVLPPAANKPSVDPAIAAAAAAKALSDQKWINDLKSAGVTLTPAQISTLQTFMALNSNERDVISIDLVRLAEQSPRQAREWIEGAVPILDKTVIEGASNMTFRRTRTSFLEAVLNDMVVEGNKPVVFTGARMRSAFELHQYSPKALYEITSIFWAYSNLVGRGFMPAGPKALKESVIQYKIAKYKERTEHEDLSPGERSELRSIATRKYAAMQGESMLFGNADGGRGIASVHN